MPLIVLEGPEKAGKSTFANAIYDVATEIARQVGIEAVMYTHHGRGDSVPEKLDAEWRLVTENPYVLFVFDRWYPSEYVYASMEMRDATVGMTMWQAYERWPVAEVGVGIILKTPVDMLIERRKGTEDEDVNARREVGLYTAVPKDWMRLEIPLTQEKMNITAEAVIGWAWTHAGIRDAK